MKLLSSTNEGLAYRHRTKANMYFLGIGLALPIMLYMAFSGYWEYRSRLSLWHEGLMGGCSGCHVPLSSSSGYFNCIRCHEDKLFNTSHQRDLGAQGCLECHSEHDPHLKGQIKPMSNSMCIKCHPKILDRVSKGGRLPDEKLTGSHVRRTMFSHESRGHCKRTCDACHELKPKPGVKLGPPAESIFSMQACAHCHENITQELKRLKKRLNDVDLFEAGKKLDTIAEMEFTFFVEDLEGEELQQKLDKLRRNAGRELAELKKQITFEKNHPPDNCMKCHKYHEKLATGYYPIPGPSKGCTPEKMN